MITAATRTAIRRDRRIHVVRPGGRSRERRLGTGLWISVYGRTCNVYVSYGKDAGRWLVDLVEHDRVEHNLYNQRNEVPFTLSQVAEFLD